MDLLRQCIFVQNAIVYQCLRENKRDKVEREQKWGHRLVHRGPDDSILGITWGVLVLLKFSHFSPERTQTGSLGATESEV